jgi:hypothetical protein
VLRVLAAGPASAHAPSKATWHRFYSASATVGAGVDVS